MGAGESSRREAGRITLIDPGADKPIFEARTLQCVHCGQHWVPKPGSGIERGFCLRCNGPVCGRECAECVPQEAQVENLEAGRPLNAPRKIIVPGFQLE